MARNTPASRRPAVTAAAQRYAVSMPTQKGGGTNSGWASEAWGMYRSVPEVRYAAQWVGNALSSATLYAGKMGPNNTIERLPDDHLASQLVAQIAGGPVGQATMLASMGPHLVVAGEFWTVIRPVIDPVTNAITDYQWRVVSTEEVTRSGRGLRAEVDGYELDIPQYNEEEPDERAPVAIRVWQPAPWRYVESDSPVRSSLDILNELQLLTASVAAIARSRINGRGVLIIPKGTRFPSPGNLQGDAEDDFIDTLISTAATAVEDPTSAAATVPIVIEVPPESVDKIRHLLFESQFDTLALELRKEAIRRFAIGNDLPVEVLLGLGDTNHWSAASIEQQAVKLGVDPRLKLITDAYTTQWLRPLLEMNGAQDAAECMVVGDTSALKTTGNQPQAALEAFQLGLISASAARERLGYDESDAPGAEAAGVVEDTEEAAPEVPASEDTADAPASPALLAEAA